jgi:hypothetical protein
LRVGNISPSALRPSKVGNRFARNYHRVTDPKTVVVTARNTGQHHKIGPHTGVKGLGKQLRGCGGAFCHTHPADMGAKSVKSEKRRLSLRGDYDDYISH